MISGKDEMRTYRYCSNQIAFVSSHGLRVEPLWSVKKYLPLAHIVGLYITCCGSGERHRHVLYVTTCPMAASIRHTVL